MLLLKSAFISLIIIGGGILLFWVVKPLDNGLSKIEFFPSRKRQYINKPAISDELMQDERFRVAFLCVCKYIDAYNEGVTDAELDKIKDAFKKEFGYILYQDEQLRLCVKDLQGMPVLKYND